MTTEAGLCGACRHAKELRTDRGSIFLQCLRSFTEPRYPKYPRLPVWSCAGYDKDQNGKEPGHLHK